MLTIKVNTLFLDSSQLNKYYFYIEEGHIHFNCKKYQELVDADKVYVNKN